MTEEVFFYKIYNKLLVIYKDKALLELVDDDLFILEIDGRGVDFITTEEDNERSLLIKGFGAEHCEDIDCPMTIVKKIIEVVE